MQRKNGLLLGLWTPGLAIWLLAIHVLHSPRAYNLMATLERPLLANSPERPRDPAPSRSFIVMGDDFDAIAEAVASAGGVITHPLRSIHAVGATLTTAQVAALERRDDVAWIQADRGLRIAGDSDNDSDSGSDDDSDSGSDNDMSDVPFSEFPRLIGADLLHWQGLTGDGVTVAVLDTGLWLADELAYDTDGDARVLARYDAINDQLHEGDDDNGHGTHVASVILSSAQPTELPGVYNGVAPDASLVVVKAFDELGNGSYLDVILGIEWIINHREVYNIRVLNLSFSAEPKSYYWDDPLNMAVMAAWEAGIVVVSSAGNNGPEPMTIGVPGNVPYIITVGAMTDAFTPENLSDDHLSSYSAVGPTVEGFVKPDLIAPGGHILGIVTPSSTIASQHPEWSDGPYFTMSGTSQSAAVISGVAALMLQASPWLTPDELKCRLLDSSRPAVGADDRLAYSPFQQGAGRVDADGAVASTRLTCANRGLDVGSDLDGIQHFTGPARWQADQGFVLGDAGYAWDGVYRSSDSVSWIVASPWISANPWVSGIPWIDANPWVDASPWISANPWVSATPWIGVRYTFSDELTETMTTDLWVDQD